MGPVPVPHLLLRRPPSWVAAGGGALLLATVGFTDWLTGPNIDFSLLYLLPVCFVGVTGGPRLAYAASVICAVAWLVVDRETGLREGTAWVAGWNLLMRLAFFAVMVAVLQSWTTFGRRLTVMVGERTARLRDLTAQLVITEDAERRKLACDMHDTVSQSLSTIQMNLDSALVGSSPLPPAPRAQVERAREGVEGVIRQVRTLTFDLYPAILDDLGLTVALGSYCREFERRTGVAPAILEHGAPRALPRVIAQYMFRSVKELLHNAVRHGRASEITVLLHWEGSALRLVVDDDGVGFSRAAAGPCPRGGGMGLAAIRERVGSLGGQLSIDSPPRGGARVILIVPLAAETGEVAHEPARLPG